MRRLFPGSPSEADDVDLWAAYAYPDDTRQLVRANMVSAVDGGATVDGRSSALGGEPDKAVFDVLRGLCDAVVVGAGTARTEGYRALRPRPEHADTRREAGQQPAPQLVLVSGRLDLDPSSALFDPTGSRTLVVTHRQSDESKRDALTAVADVVVAGDDRVDIAAALDELSSRGLRRILAEGGPHLLADIAAAGRLDELCLSLAPQLVGGDATRIVTGADVDVPLRLAHLLEEDGVLLARYSRG